MFGGQITQGRGVEDMLAAAAIAEHARPDLAFLFVGDGRLVPMVEARIASGARNFCITGGAWRETSSCRYSRPATSA